MGVRGGAAGAVTPRLDDGDELDVGRVQRVVCVGQDGVHLGRRPSPRLPGRAVGVRAIVGDEEEQRAIKQPVRVLGIDAVDERCQPRPSSLAGVEERGVEQGKGRCRDLADGGWRLARPLQEPTCEFGVRPAARRRAEEAA